MSLLPISLILHKQLQRIIPHMLSSLLSFWITDLIHMQVAQIHHKRYNIDLSSFIAIRVIEWLYVLQTLDACILKLFYYQMCLVCVCVFLLLGIRNGIEVFLNLKILLSGFYQDIVNSKYQIHMYIWVNQIECLLYYYFYLIYIFDTLHWTCLFFKFFIYF
jgi:hypothetical protein